MLLSRSEKSIQQATIRLLKKYKILYFKISDKFISGIPDIVGWHNGRSFVIELKRPINPSTTHAKLQDYYRNEIKRNGGLVFKAADIEEIKQFILQKIVVQSLPK